MPPDVDDVLWAAICHWGWPSPADGGGLTRPLRGRNVIVDGRSRWTAGHLLTPNSKSSDRRRTPARSARLPSFSGRSATWETWLEAATSPFYAAMSRGRLRAGSRLLSGIGCRRAAVAAAQSGVAIAQLSPDLCHRWWSTAARRPGSGVSWSTATLRRSVERLNLLTTHPRTPLTVPPVSAFPPGLHVRLKNWFCSLTFTSSSNC